MDDTMTISARISRNTYIQGLDVPPGKATQCQLSLLQQHFCSHQINSQHVINIQSSDYDDFSSDDDDDFAPLFICSFHYYLCFTLGTFILTAQFLPADLNALKSAFIQVATIVIYDKL